MSSFTRSQKNGLIFIFVVTFIVLLSLSGLMLVQHLKSRSEAKAELFQSINDNDYEAACAIIEKYPSLVNENQIVIDLLARLFDSVSEPPLLRACRYGEQRRDFIELFVENGADVNKRGNNVYNYPILSVLDSGHIEIAQYLIENGADLSVSREFSENVPLSVASIKADVGDIKLQIECLDILKVAIEQGAYVVPQGSDYYHRRYSGYKSVYGMAAAKNQALIVEYFLENDIHSVDEVVYKNNKTALILAAENGAYDVVKLLLESGADKSIADDNGMTAYDYAVASEDQVLIDLLSE